MNLEKYCPPTAFELRLKRNFSLEELKNTLLELTSLVSLSLEEVVEGLATLPYLENDNRYPFEVKPYTNQLTKNTSIMSGYRKLPEFKVSSILPFANNPEKVREFLTVICKLEILRPVYLSRLLPGEQEYYFSPRTFSILVRVIKLLEEPELELLSISNQAGKIFEEAVTQEMSRQQFSALLSTLFSAGTFQYLSSEALLTCLAELSFIEDESLEEHIGESAKAREFLVAALQLGVMKKNGPNYVIPPSARKLLTLLRQKL